MIKNWRAAKDGLWTSSTYAGDGSRKDWVGPSEVMRLTGRALPFLTILF